MSQERWVFDEKVFIEREVSENMFCCLLMAPTFVAELFISENCSSGGGVLHHQCSTAP